MKNNVNWLVIKLFIVISVGVLYVLPVGFTVAIESDNFLTGKRFITRRYVAPHSSSLPGFISFKNPKIITKVYPSGDVGYVTRLLFFKKVYSLNQLQEKDKRKQLSARGIPPGNLVKIIGTKLSGSVLRLKIRTGLKSTGRYGMIMIETDNKPLTRARIMEILKTVLEPLPGFQAREQKIKYLQGMYGLISNGMLSSITGLPENDIDKLYFINIFDYQFSFPDKSFNKPFKDFILATGSILQAKSRILIRKVSLNQNLTKLYVRIRYLDPLNFSQFPLQVRTGLFFHHVILSLSERFFKEVPVSTGKIEWDLRYKVYTTGKPIIEKTVIQLDRNKFLEYLSFNITAQELANSSKISINGEIVEANLLQVQNINVPFHVHFE